MIYIFKTQNVIWILLFLGVPEIPMNPQAHKGCLGIANS